MPEAYILAGINLRKLRTKRGITQKEVAGFLGVAQNSISEMESGAKKLMVFKHLDRLSEFFGVQPKEFFKPTE